MILKKKKSNKTIELKKKTVNVVEEKEKIKIE